MNKIYIKIIFLSILCTIIMLSMGSAVESNIIFQPSWKVGDTWVVRTWNQVGGFYKNGEKKNNIIIKGSSISVNFTVTNIISTKDFEIPYMPLNIEERNTYKDRKHPDNGYECYEIQVVFPKDDIGFQPRYMLYFRKDKLNLIRILNNSVRTNGTLENTKYDYPIDPNGPIFTEDIYSSLPFDWPEWQKKDLSIDNKSGLQSKVQKFEKKVKSDKDDKSYNGFVLTMSQRIKENSKDIIRSTQQWKYGYPWWIESIVYDNNGKILYEAELVIPESSSIITQ